MPDKPSTVSSQFQLDKGRIKRNFNKAAPAYEGIAELQAETGRRLMERLEYVRLTPNRVIDLGSGTGRLTRALQTRYPKSSIMALDIAHAMLTQARHAAKQARRPQWLPGWLPGRPRQVFICGDIEALPLMDQSFDMVVSNLALQWCNDLDQAIREMRRITRPGGLITFTTCGPGTLGELRQAWQSVDPFNHVNAFMDMHDIGDALLRAGLSDPVMDREDMTLTYQDLYPLLNDLRCLGASNSTQGRPPGLTGKGQFKRLHTAYERFRRDDGQLPASYEIIYGHCWVPESSAQGLKSCHQGEVRVPLANLTKKHPSRHPSRMTHD